MSSNKIPECNIVFYNQDIRFYLKEKNSICDLVNFIVKNEGKTCGDIAIIFCLDNFLLEINQKHLNHDFFTDIITFDYSESTICGDLYISIERVKENAKEYKVKIITELKRVIIHGILHLCGYKDKSPLQKKQMRKKEDYYLSLS